MDTKLTTRSTKSSLGTSRIRNVKLWLQRILANLSLTCLAVNRIFIILLSRRYSLQIHYPKQRLGGSPKAESFSLPSPAGDRFEGGASRSPRTGLVFGFGVASGSGSPVPYRKSSKHRHYEDGRKIGRYKRRRIIEQITA
jgi:hypothetical protein